MTEEFEAGAGLKPGVPTKGSIIAAAEGDAEAARRAKAIASLLIDEYR